ncbi:MAG: hypothetical protein C4538_09150 [Nitrospiraceae bacterium]|nr:MAG: hypothetical protein C4538_09150 [Nitrospiraceae bacterium]
MNTVKCPNLVEWLDWVILMCKKGDRPYVPNSTELRTYCKNKSYGKCPHNAKSNVSYIRISAREVRDHEICHK